MAINIAKTRGFNVADYSKATPTKQENAAGPITTGKSKSTWSSDLHSEMPVDYIARSRCNEF